MFKNLEYEILKKQLNLQQISMVLNISYESLLKKIKGLKKFSVKEIILLRNIIDPTLSLTYLFEVNL